MRRSKDDKPVVGKSSCASRTSSKVRSLPLASCSLYPKTCLTISSCSFGLSSLARRKTFDPSTLSTHIYSLSPALSLPTPSSLVPPFFALLSHKAYLSPKIYGSKVNGSIVVLKGAEARLKAGQVDKPESAAGAGGGAKDAGKGKKDYVAPAAQGKKVGSLDWSKAMLKKPVPPPPPPAPAPAEKKRSTSTSSSKPRATLSESEEEEDDDSTSARPKTKGPPTVARPSAPVVQKPVKEKKDVVQATNKEEKERLEQQRKELEGLWDMDVDEDEFSGNVPPSCCPPPPFLPPPFARRQVF